MGSGFASGLRLSTHDLTRRSTLLLHNLPALDIPFNSRPHKEVDMPRYTEMPGYTAFNSRPHKEVDMSEEEAKKMVELSTHDLTRRSTLAFRHLLSRSQSFNSRPHKEVDNF